MKKVIKPGRARKSINFIDNIVYSRQKDLEGNEMELKMSIMLQNGNSEMRLASGHDDEADDKTPKPAILWVPGGGYRGCDKNLMVAEMAFLADAGYVVASMYYRSSAEAHMPSQIIDVKTAIRFLRAHADEYEIATNPNFRWKSMAETHEGALMGGDPATLRERSKEFCPPYILTKEMCPMLILHGDCDKLVPCSISEEFYDKIVEAGMEDRADLCILAGAGHGTKEFFQPETKEIICAFFDKNLK